MELLVSPEKLLGRDTTPAYTAGAKQQIQGKTVLVTGAGGSIGSEIVMQCINLGAKRVIKVDVDEFALFRLSHKVFGNATFNPEHDLHAVDINNFLALSNLMAGVDVAYHAAAKKHLPLLEGHPESAIKVNVLGTLSVIKAAVRQKVPMVVNISTDKAADPTSVLGWSKRLAELIGAKYTDDYTTVSSVRFGNVLGSNGSLIPSIKMRMEKGLPVEVTDREATRYFMTIPEAASLVIEASRMAKGGEVFVLDMKDPVKIIDVINNCAMQWNMPKPQLEYIGLRPGEKLHEELFSHKEAYRKTSHPRVSQAILPVYSNLSEKISELEQLLATTTDPATLKAALTLHEKEANSVAMDPSGSTAPTLLGKR